MTEFIYLENVVKSYHMGRVDVFALKGVDLSVRRGETVGVAGPSGSGKTTLLNIIAGVDRPTAGNVFVDGRNVADLTGAALASYRRDSIGYIFQFFNLVPTLTARQNIELPMVLAAAPAHQSRERASELLRLVEMDDRANHVPAELSGGEQQRVAIAVALANDPPLLLADEPTGELDSEMGEQLIETLFTSARELNKTVVAASHDIGLLRQCERVLRLRDGRIVPNHVGEQTPE